MTLLPKDYFNARNRFRSLAISAGGQLASFPIASTSHADNSLCIDTVYLGNTESQQVLVIVCGVHGAEGYAGSACMQHFLHHFASHYAGEDVGCLLIHAVNPWGFANDSRVTEENIDLNRNFVDFAKSLPSCIEYSRFHDLICEEYRPGLGGLLNEVRLLCAILGSKRRRSFQQAVTGGQYQYKNGLFYGGSQPTQNRRILAQLLQAHLRPGQDIRVLDIHTGLGKKGDGTLLTHLHSSSSKFKTLNGWLDGQLRTTTDDANISAEVYGHLPGWTEALFGDACFAVTLEFGVAGPLFTLNALRADNWMRITQNKKDAILRKATIKKQIKRAFVSADPGWEQAILSRFDWTVARLIQSFSAN